MPQIGGAFSGGLNIEMEPGRWRVTVFETEEQHGQRPWVRKEFCHVGGTEQSQEELQHNTGEHL